MYLDYAENQAAKRVQMYMKDWAEKLDAFLVFNDYEVLNNAGSVKAQVAKQLAEAEYEAFRVVQDREYENDFDKETKCFREGKS